MQIDFKFSLGDPCAPSVAKRARLLQCRRPKVVSIPSFDRTGSNSRMGHRRGCPSSASIASSAGGRAALPLPCPTTVPAGQAIRFGSGCYVGSMAVSLGHLLDQLAKIAHRDRLA